MESRCGCGHRASLLRVNRLISLAVARLISAFDVRRKRNMAQPRDRFSETSLMRKSQKPQTVSAAAFHASFQFSVTESYAFTNGNFSSGTNQSLPKIRFNLPHQQNFDRRFKMLVSRRTVCTRLLRTQTFAVSKKPGRQHSSIVQDNQLVAAKQFGKVAEMAIV